VFLSLVVALAGLGAGASCGARTGLEVGTSPEIDAAAGLTDLPDVLDEDVPAVFPPIDASPVPDVVVSNCPDAASTLIYVVTAQNELLSFYPPSAAFTRIGSVACPVAAGWQPFSMAVDRTGTAYVLFTDRALASGQIFRVSTLTAACAATAYVGGQSGINTFGMGFVGNPDGLTDTLYVAADEGTNVASRLAKIDVRTLQMTVVGRFFPQTVAMAELSGTGDGRLFAFYTIHGATSSAVAQVDTTTAQVTANDDLVNLPQGGGWAFAFWGGDFYLFTAPGGLGAGSQVTRFRPSDGSQAVVAMLPTTIVGAGVSTCAPKQ
jgi:hypothetical protein